MGTNFGKRLLSGITISLVLGFVCYQGGWWLLILLMGVSLVGMGEYYSATFRKGYRPAAPLGFFVGLLILVATEVLGSDYREGTILGLIIGLVGLTLVAQFGNRANQSAVGNSAVTIFGVAYVPLMLSFMIRLRHFDVPAAVGYPEMHDFWHRMGALLITIASVWLCDSFALAIGSVWGHRKLAPTISPNKTVEGALAGFAAAVVTALALGVWMGMPWYHALILGALLGSLGQLGDLGKSTLKRDLGIKDFGNIFGPHGGVLDRFDAVMFGMPVCFLYLWLFFSAH